MNGLSVCHMRNDEVFRAFCEQFEQAHPALRFSKLEVGDCEMTLQPDHGGMKVFWLYEGQGEVLLRAGFRTKEGDGQRLPDTYQPELMPDAFAESLSLLQVHLDEIAASARLPVEAILSRRQDGAFVGDFANDLWKLEHTPERWSDNPRVVETIRSLFLVYRDQGYSVKTTDSYEPIMTGDQLIVAGQEELVVRGNFRCLTLENTLRKTRHIPSVMRLRYLKDSSGGCNFDFDPFRRLPLTWYMNLPGEAGDGLNFVNSHVVNIAKETSPTHFHPPKAIGGGLPQYEMYLVLDPKTYGLKTYGRKALLIVYPDLRDLRRFEEYALDPGAFVYIPPGTGHRGIDVFVNVITIPGFKPHNEYYIDREIYEVAQEAAPSNRNLFGIKNYSRLEELLS